ncbi:TonB-dependent receptor [Celeribacter sp. ULVN23_4]
MLHFTRASAHMARFTGCSVIALFSALNTAPAFAADDSVMLLDPIIVSPNYWDEPADQAATSVTVLDQDGLDAAKSPDLGAIASESSNVLFQSANSAERLVLRGMSAFDNALTDPIGYQVNGVSLPLGTMQVPHFFAAEQVTLLKGPQGTTAGRTAEAGLLSFDTIAPGALGGWRASVGIEGADAGADALGGTASILYSDWINAETALTFGIETSGTTGVISDPLGDDDGGETSRVNAVVGATWMLDNGADLTLNTVIEHEDFNKEQFRYIDGALATDRYVSSYSDPSSETRDSSVTSLTYRQSFDGFDLTSITGFTTFDRAFDLDFDGSQLALGVTEMDLSDRMLSQELRFTSTGSDEFKWAAGIYAFHQDTDVDFNLGSMSTDRHTEIDQTGVALYGTAEYLVAERLTLGAGLRLDWIDSEAEQTLTTSSGSSTYEANDTGLTALPKLTASYALAPETTLYANIARGYMPAGYNYGFASDADSLSYDAEYSWAGEIGVKHHLSERASLNVAGFYTKVKDKQITETIPGASQRISNAAEAESYGLEAELRADLSASWKLHATAGWQKARANSFETTVYDMSTGGLSAVDYSGNDLPMAPSVTYGLALAYDGAGPWSGTLSLNGSGDYYFDAANTIKQDGYRIVNASISRSLGQGKLGQSTVTLWATNLFDADYYAVAANTVRGTVVEDGAPRTFGLSFTTEW